jgi:hypothetical protein
VRRAGLCRSDGPRIAVAGGNRDSGAGVRVRRIRVWIVERHGVRLRAIVPSGPPPAIMPLSAVKAGMVGEALTVFQGTKPEPFKVRVVSVLRNFLPKQDVILIRAEDPRVEHSGIVAGMSGSPVYIEASWWAPSRTRGASRRSRWAA